MQCSVATRSAHLHEEPEMIPFLEKPSYPIMKKLLTANLFCGRG